MRFLLLVTILFSTSCQVYNNASKDKFLYGSNIDPNSNFGKAYTVILNRCATCHHHNVFSSYTTEQAWVTAGLVTAGNLSASRVYYRLIGANLGIDSETMPTDGVLTTQELSDIRNWIQNM